VTRFSYHSFFGCVQNSAISAYSVIQVYTDKDKNRYIYILIGCETNSNQIHTNTKLYILWNLSFNFCEKSYVIFRREVRVAK